ncbi:MAG: GPW/gp25 family protein [Butyrivibrio sp.]|nr:GPW/gp25 family protein [Butyrivibrio sp.]
MEQSFLGTGMKFPPQVDPATGRFVTVSEEESIRESVYLILMTQRTERLMRPGFGSRLLSYTFMDMSNTSLSIMVRDITETLREQEPRIENISVVPQRQNRGGVLLVQVDYTIRSTNTRDNLVFPFYLNITPEEEENEPEFYEPEIVESV